MGLTLSLYWIFNLGHLCSLLVPTRRMLPTAAYFLLTMLPNSYFEPKCLPWHIQEHFWLSLYILFLHIFRVISSHLILVHFPQNAGGGVWALYPVVFSVNSFSGIFHSIITMILCVTTLSSFSLAAFQCAGKPPNIQWGIYPVVRKGDLEDYTFCRYCSKPKSPRTHHCRTCRMCIWDMDHHCPFVSAYHLSHLTILYIRHGWDECWWIMLNILADLESSKSW